jgi:hypothetical protein
MDSQGWEKKNTHTHTQGTKSSQPTTQLVLLDRYIRKQHETVAAADAAAAATDQLKRKNWVFVCVDFLMTKMSFEGCVCVCVCDPPTHLLLLATVCLLAFVCCRWLQNSQKQNHDNPREGLSGVMNCDYPMFEFSHFLCSLQLLHHIFFWFFFLFLEFQDAIIKQTHSLKGHDYPIHHVNLTWGFVLLCITSDH